jgi:hypothetical protein
MASGTTTVPARAGSCPPAAIYGFAAGVRSVASPQKWGRQSYRMDFTPSKIIAIKRALETNVKEEAKERMVAVHASPATFPEQAKSSAARLRALVRILQSREEIPTGSPGPEEPRPFAASISQAGRAPQWELRMIEYAERAYSRAMKLAEMLVKSKSEEEAREEAKSLIALCDRCGREMRPGHKNPFGYVGEQFAEHLRPAAARYLESKVDVVAAEEALRTALFRIDNAIRPFRGRQT